MEEEGKWRAIVDNDAVKNFFKKTKCLCINAHIAECYLCQKTQFLIGSVGAVG